MSQPGGTALIGEDLVIEGEVRNGGEVEVRGAVLGTLAAERVIVHPGGRVIGTLTAGSADVNGLLDGRIRVRNLINIGASGVVLGDVRYGQLALAPGGDLAAEVHNVPPDLTGDFEVLVRRGRSVRVTSADLSARDPDNAASELTYLVSNVEHGHLARTSAPGTAVETFTEVELAAGTVLFVHDGGSADAAGFDVVVTDAAGATSGVPRRVRVLVTPDV
ncbi:MAG: cadherin-like domain-containing protein [Hyphomicrobiaceae bacterium]|nr:cadherin-like domain-containing protein [Hyphomicrobiaceae bacterium]